MSDSNASDGLNSTVKQATALLGINLEGITYPRIPELACQILQDFIDHAEAARLNQESVDRLVEALQTIGRISQSEICKAMARDALSAFEKE